MDNDRDCGLVTTRGTSVNSIVNLAEAARLADEGCPFSALLKRAGATVEVSSRLA